MNNHTPSVPALHPASASADFAPSPRMFDLHGNLPRRAVLAGVCVNATTEHDAPPACCVSVADHAQQIDTQRAVSELPLPAPPGSNTGGKVAISTIMTGLAAGLAVNESSVVKIDTLTVSFDGSGFGGELPPVRRWLDRMSGGVLTVGGLLSQHYNGYARCFGLLLVSGQQSPMLGWLGVSDRADHMRGRWCLHLTGAACQVLLPGVFLALSMDLERLSGKITRIDLAVDDLTGVHSVEQVKSLYESGAFAIGGRPPKWEHICSSDGDTFYVGQRGSGKYYRCYQKGRQLGDDSSPWVRHEVEFHCQNRVLPLAMLANPLEYFKGAYPDVFDWIEGAATMIDTSRAKHAIVFSAAMLFAKRQVGRLVRYCQDKLGYAEQQIVNELISEPGRYPLRLFFNLDDLDFDSRGLCEDF